MIDELKEKEQIIQELQERCQQADSDQTLSKRSAATIRSLETQLKASDQFILKLKKQNKELEEESEKHADGNMSRKPTRTNKQQQQQQQQQQQPQYCLLYTSPSPRDATLSRMPSSA